MKNQFLSTPSARRATERLDEGVGDVVISIHALREEGDLMMLRSSVSAILFLSTPSARRATEGLSSSLSLFVYFYPRPPRGGRQLSLLVCLNFF